MTTTECPCGDQNCRTTQAWCKGCQTRGDFHVSTGEIHPVEYWECQSGRHTFERWLMTGREILREARRGFVYAP